jgi:hypothetical protein
MILGSGREPLSRTIYFRAALFCLLLAFPLFGQPADDRDPAAAELDAVEKAVFSFPPDPHYPHDPFMLVTLIGRTCVAPFSTGAAECKNEQLMRRIKCKKTLHL